MGNKTEAEKKTLEAIIEGIQRIKGKDITLIDLNTIQHTECGYFVVCHGTSTTQVDSIAHSVEETVKEITNENAWHRDGDGRPERQAPQSVGGRAASPGPTRAPSSACRAATDCQSSTRRAAVAI